MDEILSVGIDVGTTTTQVVFSKLRVKNTASYFSAPKVAIVDKVVVYKSNIQFTPFRSHLLIDGDKVFQIVRHEFDKAGFSPSDISSGAAIITGEAAHKENAAVVIDKLSNFAGEFVVSTAGPDLEAILAGKGSGAAQYSIDKCCTVANLDIGGGTTNIAVFKNGEVFEKGSLDIGGRLIRIDSNEKIEYISASAQLIAKSLGIDIKTGERADVRKISPITDKMNALLEQALGHAPREQLLEDIRTPGSTPFALDKGIDRICFSGGVAEFIYNDTGADAGAFLYGDIGAILGESIKRGRLFPKAINQGGETIRATVVGAGIHAVTVSGSTITITSDAFPIKNVPVLYIDFPLEQTNILEDPDLLKERIAWFQRQSGRKDFILAFRGNKNAGYHRIERLAQSIAKAVSEAVPPPFPLIVVVQSDISKVLGQTMGRFLEKRRDIVCIDGIEVSQGDYVDIGRPIADGMAVPVIVKTLIFE
jgi:ethanolamine utilization protein EutA